MKLFRRNRRPTRQSQVRSRLILWTIAVVVVYSVIAPFFDSSRGQLRPATERRERATAAKSAASARATSKPSLQGAASKATPTQVSGSDGCYRHSQAWVSGNMNIRQQPSTSARILGRTPIGERYPVLGSRQGEVYCWLDIDLGWMAVTRFVSPTKSQASSAPVAAPKSDAPPAAPSAENPAVTQALEALRRLAVAPENRCSPYDSDDYPHSQSLESQIVARMGGRIYGPYTGTIFSSVRETDIEHIVAKSEAHDSGLCAADAQTRKSFARDLLNLTLASPRVNRHQKSGKDFAEWTPARNKCWYADAIIKVKAKYRLSVDSREKAALENTLQSCPSVNMAM